ncbi:MAG: acyl carrier protein [Woeseiaceae bacterium]|nr:acyl carrier protein [Woeseiaceae bacterium]NIP20843.1 acyl carrier protein [Woeseiaceae bacterium]NIS89636.1 acyl carrier protein [Woeseiaceae bacterium]
MDTDNLYGQLKAILIDQFELDESSISPDADLYDELELDSIDAVDLLVQLKNITGKKISPDEFQDVRTINDVIGALTNST